jgi:hypothetical protein
MSRVLNVLGNRLTDGGKFVDRTRLQHVTTFSFGRGHNVKSFEACFMTGVAYSHTVY